MKCPQYEDFRYLACCAVSGDYSTLTEELIRPSQLSEAGRTVATWILLKYQASVTGDTAQWPPSYETLRFHFTGEDYRWPDAPPSGVDPSLLAYEILHNEQTEIVNELYQTMTRVLAGGLDDGSRPANIDDMLQKVEDLRYLLQPGKSGGFLGSKPEDRQRALDGANSPFAALEINPYLDKLWAPYEAGLHVFYARPGQMKSSYLLTVAAALAYGRDEARVLLVDPENNSDLLLRRLYTLLGKLRFSDLSSFVGKRAKKAAGKEIEFTEAEIETREIAEEVSQYVADARRIVFLGKGDIPPGQEGLNIATIIDTARRVGARIVFVDQAHTLYVDGLPKNASRDQRILAVATHLSNCPDLLVFATTQQNRQNEFKLDSGTLPEPTGSELYGGDGLYQKASGVANLLLIPAPRIGEDGGDITADTDDEEDVDKEVLLVITPVKARASAGRSRIYVRLRPFDIFEYLPRSTGRLRAEALLAVWRREKHAAKKGAQARAKSTESRPDEAVSAPMSTISNVAARLVRSRHPGG